MSWDKRTPYLMQDPRVPQKPPFDLSKEASSSPSSITTPDGHIVHYRRRSIFNRFLCRIWQALRDPRRITWREVCWATFSGYASYQLLQTLFKFYVIVIMILFFYPSPKEDKFGRILMFAGLALAECMIAAVPWALVCAVVLFVGEEIWRRLGRG